MTNNQKTIRQLLIHLSRLANFFGVFDVYLYLKKLLFDWRVLCLIYHRVSPFRQKIDTDVVSPKAFEEQLGYLKKNRYEVIPLDVLANRLREREPLPAKGAVITFDDGYKDNYIYAFPILKKYDFPATIFLSTGFVGSDRFPDVDAPLLSWEEIDEMSKNRISFGAHTINHPDLTTIPLEQAREEILYSKKLIEDKIGKEVKAFAYPFGKFNRQVMELVIESGFTCSVTVAPRWVTSKTNPYAIERIGGSSDFCRFKLTISGFYHDIKSFSVLKERRL